MPPVVIELRNAEDWRDVVHQAVQALAEGKLVAFPTETVYGVAASALDEEAVQRLVDVKGRQPGHPLTLAIKSADEARDYAPDMSPLAQRLARRCWPGPVTLVVDDFHPESLLHQLPAGVQQWVAPEQTIGLRVPGHQVILDVLRMLAGPWPSAAPIGRGSPRPSPPKKCSTPWASQVDLVLDDGPCRFGEPSSVVRVQGNRYEILRAGRGAGKDLAAAGQHDDSFCLHGQHLPQPHGRGDLPADLLAKRLGCEIEQLEDRGVLVMSAGVAAGVGRPRQPRGGRRSWPPWGWTSATMKPSR